MNIITGYKGTPHVSAQQDRDINSAIFSSGVFILNIGSKLAATIVSANEVTIADGIAIAQGCAAEIARGTSESITIENGAQGQLRKDLIVLRYTKDASTGVEDMELAVIKGTPAASNPATPTYTRGTIADGDTLVEFPLYEVNLSGITIQSVIRIPSIVSVAKTSDVSAVSSALNTLSNTVTSLSNKIGNTAMGTAATTVTAAVRELLTKINTLTTNLGTTNSNVSSVTSRASALETKTAGIVGTKQYTVEANSRTYIPLKPTSTYVIIIDAYTVAAGVRGMYLVGSANTNQLGIKAISSAANAELVDSGTIGGQNGILRITNSGGIALRVTVITTFGTAV
jgi:hypothetical protein